MDMTRLSDQTPSFPLFVSAARPDSFAAACAAGSDMVVIDLEDSVAPDSKAAVRRIPQRALPQDRSVTLYLRVNGAGTLWHRDDLAFARMAGVDGIVLPKSDSAEQIAAVRGALRPGQKIIAQIETVRGLSRVEQIAELADRLAFGSIDLSEDLGCAHTRLSLLPLRSRLVQAARLAGAPPPLDGVTVSVTDAAAIADDARHASELGFGGKCLIHPRQLAPARAGFRTTPQDLDWARHALAAEEDALPDAEAEMLRSPVVARARRLLLRGQAQMAPAAGPEAPARRRPSGPTPSGK
ncbi:HpcH/HpaI aldolase/citrate lyase family protein [Salipiger marinus]|uniref:Citrate lyase subunit beta / citryl-CoA lyase n=1 Tax=Salipiger marinus TaxID=555512 RepID=A0A1G8PAD3_9RHOB|nr:CoA ester lyase [Salipiger marinus]SDI89473.1 citrate lyase subunit beta / citryl-CoA lyase [Salipiger marinus]